MFVKVVSIIFPLFFNFSYLYCFIIGNRCFSHNILFLWFSLFLLLPSFSPSLLPSSSSPFLSLVIKQTDIWGIITIKQNRNKEIRIGQSNQTRKRAKETSLEAEAHNSHPLKTQSPRPCLFPLLNVPWELVLCLFHSPKRNFWFFSSSAVFGPDPRGHTLQGECDFH